LVAVTGTNHHGFFFILGIGYFYSSFYAFKETLNRFIQSSEIMLKMIDNDKIIIAPNINISQYILEDKKEELMELLARESLTDPSLYTWYWLFFLIHISLCLCFR
jgi:hypothetical protein